MPFIRPPAVATAGVILPDPLVVLSPHSPAGSMCGMAPSAPASATYPTANLAIFYPVRVTRSFTAAQLFVLNGATASGNIDVGIYDSSGTRLVSSGSTAQSGTSAVQAFNIADTLLAAGWYYLAVAMDNTTGTLLRSTVNHFTAAASVGVGQQSSAFPLPATATIVRAASGTHFICVGATSRVGFV